MISRGASLSAYSVIQRVVKVAAGVFAPGHLGELTQQVPFEMVDAALAEAGPRRPRVREVPARVVVYLLLAGALFAELGYGQVWDKLVAGLDGVAVVDPSSGVLAQARQRLGPGPLRALFDLIRGPGPAPRTPGRWWRGLLVCAIDGTSVAVAASKANDRQFLRHRCNHGGSGYPKVRLLALVCCGTRTVIDAVFGSTDVGEVSYARRLVASLRAGMVVLLDRGFAAADLLQAIAAAKADLVVRAKTNRRLPMVRRLPDGSYLSVIADLLVRVIECEIRVQTTAGCTTSVYRLVTTLTDHRRYPAFDVVGLYHQRWEIQDRVPGAEIDDPGRPGAARADPGGSSAGDLRLAGRLPGRPAGHGRCHRHPRRPGSGPGVFHHRVERRPRPGGRGHERDRRHHNRSDRCHRSSGPGQPHARASDQSRSSHRQASDLQVQRQRTRHRPHDLPSHNRYQHLRAWKSLTTPIRGLTERHCV
jgi:Insertion element 4 transposase N-terminal/Transposase DDE domain